MSRPAATRAWTADDFLAWERKQEGRYEWDGASIVAMTGATLGHNSVSGNVYRALHAQLPSRCRAFIEGVKLRAGEAIRSPDVVVACLSEFDLRSDVLEDASVVVEVLSPSTARIDRGTKVTEYARAPSLQSYLIVDPERRHMELYRREGAQLVAVAAGEAGGDRIPLTGDLGLQLDDVYAGVL